MKPYTFDSGHNDPQLIPVQGLAEAARIVIAREGQRLAIYNQGAGPQGYPGLRDFVGKKLAQRGITAAADDILITSGSGQAIDLVNNLLLEAGDTVLVEAYSYAGALRKLKARGINIIGIPLDKQGIRTDALATLLAELAQKNITPKYIYTIPTVQNPTGAILGLARRQELVALARRYQTLILEDECYADIIWQGEAPPALYALAPEWVIHISTFSKSLAPSLRVAYLTALPTVLRQLIALKNDGGTGALDQLIAAEYFSAHFDEHIARLRQVLGQKLAVMAQTVNDAFGEVARPWLPQGGIFLWVELPEGTDTRLFVAPAAEQGISFNPGSDWAADAEGAKHWLRLCFALASEQQIRDGVRKLAQIILAHPALAKRRVTPKVNA